jgi:acyl-coenzyme A synthetase/AMP-(fatty) acid ligase/3-hydroxymyristoyl/3-hydroxydecanoyl-(acyl carrier protein) dehydratase
VPSVKPQTYDLCAAHDLEDRVAFGPSGDRTAADLWRDALAVARVLPESRPGSHVVVVANDRYLFAAALCGAWHRGHAVALPPNARPETVLEVSRRPEVVALCHDTERQEGFDLREVLAGAGTGRGTGLPLRLGADRLLATVFTSGSTGVSQACPKRAFQLLGEARALRPRFPPGPGFRVVATVPPHHIYGLLFSVLVPLEAGGAFFRAAPLHAETIAARIAEHRATVLVGVPVHLRCLELLEPGRLAGLEVVFSSAAPLPPETAQMVKARHGLAVTEVLGSSETGGIAWRRQVEGPLWRPLEGVSLSASDAGELCVDAPWLDPELPRPHRTADRVRFEADGFVHLGRTDGVVKIGGKRIATLDIERRLLGLHGVKDAAVLAVPGRAGRDHEFLAAVVAPGRTPQDLKQGLSEWFDPSVLPRRLEMVEALPREDNGKLTRDRFLALFGRSPGGRVLGPPPEEHRFELELEADFPGFQGHFPGSPVLPAGLQLSRLVLPRVPSLGHGLGSPQRPLVEAQRLRFMIPLRPLDRVELTLAVAAPWERVDFTISKQGRAASSGRLRFAVAAR